MKDVEDGLRSRRAKWTIMMTYWHLKPSRFRGSATAFVNVNVGAARDSAAALSPLIRAAHSAAKFQFQASIFEMNHERALNVVRDCYSRLGAIACANSALPSFAHSLALRNTKMKQKKRRWTIGKRVIASVLVNRSLNR